MTQKGTRLSGRSALVTGSTGGLGVAIAKRLAAEGARVVVSGRSRSRGEQVAIDIRSAGGGAGFVQVDLHEGHDALRHFAAAVTEAAGGQLDVMVNNAASLLLPTATGEVPADTLREAFEVNVFAPFLLTGIIAPQMPVGAAIINIGSITGLRGSGGSAVYNASKAAIHSLTTSWADEYGPVGVRVNAVAPGPISTERHEEFAEYLEPVLARLPSRRASTPEEVAAAVAFLASDEASNIHGAIVSVDGGWAAV
ncbi:SDR family NAD(P)-dependent oxidoreductase [Mycobacteroides abscessus]|uniref:SDR family NAD(P)-dependent oxidoreductase n=1 Tax=Mycobacteroides abscessus TaxID=36809 RepID=UPI00078C3ECC|nr:SDR family oxidoreductase [Mycobacteroides abscessus]AMU75377.1 short-chain dehydrogenase [Mycobacteroides abscessus]ANO24322.1 short-chain dehydrogenase [Mycobacteroides abscessus]MBN7318521.1 SDR family oxidoreductase [Mycobacteroides abscessus subsp. massiliense]